MLSLVVLHHGGKGPLVSVLVDETSATMRVCPLLHQAPRAGVVLIAVITPAIVVDLAPSAVKS